MALRPWRESDGAPETGFSLNSFNSGAEAFDFLSNLLFPGYRTIYSKMSPEELAEIVRGVMVMHVGLFERGFNEKGKRVFKLDKNGHLIPRSEAKETDGMSFEQLEEIYKWALNPLSFKKFEQLIGPLKTKVQGL